MNESQHERKHFLLSLSVPVLIVLLMWGVFVVDGFFGLNLSQYGLTPRSLKGLVGILTMPLLHGGWEHLISNSVPIVILGTAVYYFYPTIANRIVLLTWTVSGLLTWCIADSGTHVGASAFIYGLNLFLVTSGLIRGNKSLLAISFIMIFLYGSFVWGIFPAFTEPRNISWQGHLAGLLTGLMLAIYYRHEGPQRDEYKWDDDDDDNDENNDGGHPYWDVPQPDIKDLTVRYRFKK